jgi:NADH-quinone oxidoreductase subunit N
VKYFFLGALGAAMFLYGFAMLYGATGSTNLNAIYRASLTTGA